MLVSGAWEYVRPNSQPPSTDELQSLFQAYNTLRYDVGLLSRDESRELRNNGIVTQGWQQPAYAAPFEVKQTPNGDKVGFLRLPSLPAGQNTPSAELIERISKRIEKERLTVRLIIALSDWGWVGERDYMAQNPKYVPDFLLGSGPGSGINGRLQADDRCVWVRPYDKGRSISEIIIYSWPKRKNSFAWMEAKNYKTASIGLNDSYKDNPEVAAILY